MINELKNELVKKIINYFPSSKIEISEKRSILLEIRAILNENTFIEIYINIMTGKKSFSLISFKNRLTGYDNYKFWHYHPLDNTDVHLPCEEPSLDLIFTKLKEAYQQKFDSK